MMMEQKTVTGFFPVVKNNNSSFAIHPAKRRKVEEVTSNTQLLKKPRSRNARSIQERSAKRNKKNSEVTVSTLLSAAPLLETSETTSHTDEHNKPKRKTKRKPENKLVKEKKSDSAEGNPSLLSEKDSKEEHPDRIKINPWISEQAKLVLAVGRGCAAVSAAYSKGDQSSEKSLRASDVLKPTSVNEKSENKGNVKEEFLKRYQSNIKSSDKKGRLREKFSHLLGEKDHPIETKNSTESSEGIQSKSTLRVPAHQRFKHLASKTTAEQSFVLPQKYKLLLDIFRTVDSVLFLLHRRSETCTFERLKKSVQSMLGRKFTEKYLAQMKTVLPSAFVFRIEKNLRDLNGMPSKPQLTIDANFEEVTLHQNGSKSDINQNVLITRRHTFESALISITKNHHQKYLKKLNLKISDDELKRWHPHFKLEEVADIEEASLPQAVATKTITSAKDILGRSHNIPQVEKALQNVAESSSNKQPVKPTDVMNHSNFKKSPSSTETNGILKGVSSSLLERIKEKEKKKAELAMLRDPKQERRLAMMDKLPDIVRIIKTYFTSERKAAIPVEDCVVKITQSFGASTASCDIEEQIKLLHELAPDWLSVVPVRKCLYVKISKTFDVNLVLQKLNSIKEQEMNK